MTSLWRDVRSNASTAAGGKRGRVYSFRIFHLCATRSISTLLTAPARRARRYGRASPVSPAISAMRVSRALSSTVRLALAMGRPESRGTGRAFSNVGGSKVMMGTDFILLIMPTLATNLLEKSCSHEAGVHNSTEPTAPLTAESFSIAAISSMPPARAHSSWQREVEKVENESEIERNQHKE